MPKTEIHVAHLWQNLKCTCSKDGSTTVQLRSYVYKRHMNFYDVLILRNKNQNYTSFLKLPHNQHEDVTFMLPWLLWDQRFKPWRSVGKNLNMGAYQIFESMWGSQFPLRSITFRCLICLSTSENPTACLKSCFASSEILIRLLHFHSHNHRYFMTLLTLVKWQAVLPKALGQIDG